MSIFSINPGRNFCSCPIPILAVFCGRRCAARNARPRFVAAKAGPVPWLSAGNLARFLLLLWTGIGWPFLLGSKGGRGQYWGGFSSGTQATRQCRPWPRPFPPQASPGKQSTPIPWGNRPNYDGRPVSIIDPRPVDPEFFSSYSPRLARPLEPRSFPKPTWPRGNAVSCGSEDIDGRLPNGLATGPSYRSLGQWYDACSTRIPAGPSV